MSGLTTTDATLLFDRRVGESGHAESSDAYRRSSRHADPRYARTLAALRQELSNQNQGREP